jgi:hypothetical protein
MCSAANLDLKYSGNAKFREALVSYYGVTRVRLDDKTNEIAEMKLHKLGRDDIDRESVGIDEGRTVTYQEVANLLRAGDIVWVLVPTTSPGAYFRKDRVRTKPGRPEYLESYDSEGRATRSLSTLPLF